MSDLIKKLRDRRTSVWEEAKVLADRAADENRAFDGEEQVRWDLLNNDLDSYDSRIKQLLDGEARAKETEDAYDRVRGHKRDGSAVSSPSPEMAELSNRFRQLRPGRDPIDIPPGRPGTWAPHEARALATNVGTASTLLATDFYTSVVERALDESGLLASGPQIINSPDGVPLTIPRVTSYSTGTWIPEGGVIASSDPGFATVTLLPHKAGFQLSVNNELLQDNSFDLAGYLARWAGRVLGRTIGPTVVSGASGQPYPRGFLTDVVASVTGASGQQGAPSADNMIDLMFALADAYRRSPSAAWIMNKTTLRGVRKLKDTSNNYLFGLDMTPNGRTEGLILGRPVYTDEWMPTGTGAESVAFGDWSNYCVRWAGSMRWESDDSRGPGWDTDRTFYRALVRVDGALLDLFSVATFQGGS